MKWINFLEPQSKFLLVWRNFPQIVITGSVFLSLLFLLKNHKSDREPSFCSSLLNLRIRKLLESKNQMFNFLLRSFDFIYFSIHNHKYLRDFVFFLLRNHPFYSFPVFLFVFLPAVIVCCFCIFSEVNLT